MAETREIELQWPVRGLVRSAAVQRQAPYSTPNCLNVRPRDVFEDRVRGGSRPGINKAYQEDLGGPFQLLGSVRPINRAGGGLKAYDWGAYAAPGPNIDYAAWTHVPNSGRWTTWQDNIAEASIGVSPTDTISAAYLPNPASGSTYKAAYTHEAVTDQDTADGKTYVFRVRLRAAWLRSLNYWKGEHYVWGGMNSGLDPDANGWEVKAFPSAVGSNNSTWSVTLTRTLGSSVIYGPTTVPTNLPAGHTGDLLLEIYVTNDVGGPNYHNIRVLLGGFEFFDITDTTDGADAGYRFGFGMVNAQTGSGAALPDFPMIDYFNFIYPPTTSSANRRRMAVAVVDGSLWYENDSLQMIELTSDLTLNEAVALQGVEYDGKFFIADYGDTVYEHESGSGQITGGNGRLSLASGNPDWTTLGIDDDDHVIEVLDHATGDVVGTFRITTIAAGYIELKKSDNTTFAANDTGLDFRISRGPKVFNPDDLTLSLYMAENDDNFNQVPTGCQLMNTYQDRIVLARSALRPGVWFMSRQSDPYDWDLSPDASDIRRSVAGTSTDAGVLPDPLTAAISGMNDYFLFGTENSLWLLRGNPVAGGRIDNLSRVIGIAAPEAYCYGPAGEIVFLSRDGLYMLPPGATAVPQSISREVIPKELTRIDTKNSRVILEYNVIDQGVHVFLSSTLGTNVIHYWFDWRTRGFWPESFDTDHDPMAVHGHLFPGEDERIVLIGCRDGYIRKYDSAVRSDDGSAISSFMDFGPLMLGPGGMFEGAITQLNARLAATSDDVTWSIRVGETPEEAVLSDAFDTGTWSAGLNYTDRPRARGAYAYIRLANSTAARAWALETLFMAVRKAGRLRKA